MIQKHGITREQALHAIETGEFGEDVTRSCDNVVVVLTQDWCPQWMVMKRWIYALPLDVNVHVFELVYNKFDLFDEFKNFKETVWKNDTIPYLRFYKDGSIYHETNYISEQTFNRILHE